MNLSSKHLISYIEKVFGEIVKEALIYFLDFLVEHYGHNRWKQTWDNRLGLTKNYAGIGYTYDPIKNAFISNKPFDSFILNEDTCMWEAPIAKPSDKTKLFYWDEDALSWIEENRFNYKIENEVITWQ